GRRWPVKDSPHVALRNPGFRAYADHMATEEFLWALDRLAKAGSGQRTVILCAERLPWQCHRHLIADCLVTRGVRVLHLLSPGKSIDHTLNRLARSDGSRLVYDVGDQFPLEI
ncbi:MAG: DUF488 family protein, partial [Burkholderiales bacterium]